MIKCSPVHLCSSTLKARSAKILSSIINGKRINHIKRLRYPEFLEAEELTTETPRRCKRCIGCKRCSYQSQELSHKEQEEYCLLSESTSVDLEKKCVRTGYLIVGDITKMKDNHGEVIRQAEGLEKSLKKRELTKKYNEVFKEYVR